MIAGALWLSTLMLVGATGAAELGRVVILAPAVADPTAVRLRDELRLLGLVAELRVAAGDQDLAAVGSAAASAVVAQVQREPAQVVIWFGPDAARPDAMGGGASVAGGAVGAGDGGAFESSGPVGTELVVARPTIDAGPGALALAAAELIRAKLIELPAGVEAPLPTEPAGDEVAPATPGGRERAVGSAPPASAEPATADRTAAAADGQAGALALALGPAVGLSPGGVPASFHLRLGADYRLLGLLGVGGWLLAPTAAARIDAVAGQIDLRLIALGAMATWRLTPQGAPVELLGGAGAGVAVLLFDGNASAPYRPESGSRVVALPHVLLALRYPLRRWLVLRADLTAALALPQPIVRIAGEQAAAWGRPLMVPSIGLEVMP